MLTSHVRWSRAAAFVALAGFGCGGGSPTDSGGGGGGAPVVTTQVAVKDNNSFNPASIQVSPGATVTWTWEGTTSEDHNVTFTSPQITSSGNMRSGTHQAQMPNAAGTYNYSCTLHSGMNGSVRVQ